MAQPPEGSAADKRPDTPRWVKALAVAAVVAVLVVIVVMLVAGGQHGPMRHGGWVDSGGRTFLARRA